MASGGGAAFARPQVVDPSVFAHLLYQGSVKDVYGRAEAPACVFVFSDRYSIFDWGEMPDPLPGKGEALAVLGDLFFRALSAPEGWAAWRVPERYPKFWRDGIAASDPLHAFRREGLAHHSLGLVDPAGLGLEPGQLSNRLAVRAHPRPAATASLRDGKVHWDYSAYQARPENALVPLEVVFRFGAPEGSSFLSRVERAPGYAASLGFPEIPKAGDRFPFPIVEYFTKLEPSDRFLPREEAARIAALSQAELDDLGSATLLLALRLHEIFARLGLELWDGKFEFAFRPGVGGRRGFVLVDSIGPDELRLIGPEGVHFSKEFLRRVYRGSAWYSAMDKAKKQTSERGQTDWKRICREELHAFPEKLAPEALEAARWLYPGLAQAVALALGLPEPYAGLPGVAELSHRLKGVS